MGIDQESWEKDHPPVEPRRNCIPKPTSETMIAGILESCAFATASKQYERSVMGIERAVRTGCFKAYDRTQSVEGDEKPTVYEAIESLYVKLATMAAEEERNASAKLAKLGVKK